MATETVTTFSALVTIPEQVNYFPNLPPYSDPTTGIFAKLPETWIPYLQLMRIDRPAGFYAFYLPYVIGLLYAACIADLDHTPSVSTLCWYGFLLIPFNMLLRGIACTWNDNVDQEFDRRVRRCRHRPIARGAVSTSEAHVFMFFQLLAICAMLELFPAACKPHFIMSLVTFLVYALMKRVTYYPQAVLGFPFAWAIFFCISIVDPDALRAKLGPSLALFGANLFWTIIYDTIYAHQDVVDDEKAGVKGMALRFKENTKLLAVLLALGQVGMLALCGVWAHFSGVYFIGTVGGVSVAMACYISSVDLKRPESCGIWFQRQFWLVGSGHIAGLLAEFLLNAQG